MTSERAVTSEPSTFDRGPVGRPSGELELGRFSSGGIVHLAAGDPRRSSAMVVLVDDATVVVTDRRIYTGDTTTGWSWPLADLQAAVHGADETWTILVTPDVPDFGVAVDPDDIYRFRQLVDDRLGPVVQHQVVDLDGPSNGHRDVPAWAPQPEWTATAPAATWPAPTTRLGGVAEAHPPIEVEATTELPAQEPIAGAISSNSMATAGAAGGVSDLAGIDARSISAWFGSHQVLDRVSLEMPAGHVTSLIGPSGCGKSTFLRILNRMHEMIPGATMAGQVVMDGHDVYDPARKLTEARREIGMVFQKPNPFPAMSIYDNTIASLRLTGARATTDEKDEIVESCLSKAGLWNEVKDRLRQPGGGLSGGQQQRLCIARALAIQPRVLLMDEPCSALDPTSTRRIEETIVELVEEVTIVIVTHNMQQAARVSDLCAFFLAEHGTPGVIVEHGPTSAMFTSPQDPRTDDYVNGRFG